MALSRERVLDLHAIVGDCQRFGDRMGRPSIIDIEKALSELLAAKVALGRAEGRVSLPGSWMGSLRSMRGNSQSY